jgi:hypothetical protein
MGRSPAARYAGTSCESIRPLAPGATRKIVHVVTSTAQSPITEWQPFREPLRATLTRTIGIALVGGALLALRWGGMARWPVASVMVLWPALGGHFLELWFLNWLRPRLPRQRGAQIAARIVVWFLGGVVFALAMWLTAGALTGGPPPSARPVWWIGGLVFIGIELVAQLVLRLLGRPSFYDGKG